MLVLKGFPVPTAGEVSCSAWDSHRLRRHSAVPNQTYAFKTRPRPLSFGTYNPMACVCFIVGERRCDCDRRRSVPIG